MTSPPVPPTRHTHTARFGLAVVLATVALAGPVAAQLPEADLPIQLDAESSDFDRRNSRLVFRGIRVEQGDFGIEADLADSADLEFSDSTWEFRGNVRITTPNGDIEAATARLVFSGGRLVTATIDGAPARFRQETPPRTRVTADRAELKFSGRRLSHLSLLGKPANFETTGANRKSARGQAGRVDYDLATEVLTLTDNAWLNEGDNTISGNTIVYNMTEERVLANGGEQGDRVRITILPPPITEKEPAATGDDTGSPAP